VFELRVHPSDLERVIGRQGHMADSIRTIMAAAGLKLRRPSRWKSSNNNSPSTLESSCLLLDKELFLRFPYHPLQKPTGNVGVQVHGQPPHWQERISMRRLFLLLALASTGCGHRRAYTSGHPQSVDTDSGEYRVLQTHEGDYATFYCHVRDGSTVCKPVQ
jgi:hypothetical protein